MACSGAMYVIGTYNCRGWPWGTASVSKHLWHHFHHTSCFWVESLICLRLFDVKLVGWCKWITRMCGLRYVLRGQSCFGELCPWRFKIWLLLSIVIPCGMQPFEEVVI